MVDGWTFLEVTIASVVVSVLAAAVSTMAIEAAVRRGWAYRVEPKDAPGWMGRTVGTRPDDRSGVNASAIMLVTLFLTVAAGMSLASVLFGW